MVLFCAAARRLESERNSGIWSLKGAEGFWGYFLVRGWGCLLLCYDVLTPKEELRILSLWKGK